MRLRSGCEGLWGNWSLSACSQDQAGVLCHNKGRRERGRAREREEERQRRARARDRGERGEVGREGFHRPELLSGQKQLVENVSPVLAAPLQKQLEAERGGGEKERERAEASGEKRNEEREEKEAEALSLRLSFCDIW